MNTCTEKVTDLLFETGAIKVSPARKPFWYTSGKVGPYYINTHFLYGSEDKARELLEFIDRVKGDIYECPVRILEKCSMNYDKEETYRQVIDCMMMYIEKNMPVEKISCISGGERRDWFFSLIVADIMGLPHLTLYKNGECVVLNKGETYRGKDIGGGMVLHVADLVNVASSYLNNWIPSIQNINGKIKWSLVVVDRLQGGAEQLSSEGIEPHSITRIDRSLFKRAFDSGIIDDEEFSMLLNYLEDPEGSMKCFIESKPGFIRDSLEAGGKTASRAQKCIENGYYGL